MKKLKLSKNIVLIGFMGAGKSSVAQLLSSRLNIKSFSTDRLIEQKAKCSIAQIVIDQGWDYFRRMEHQQVKKLSSKKGIIIDCGGGVVLNPDNLKLLKKHGIIFYLKVTPQVIYNRLKDDRTRPLISGSNPKARIKEILKTRIPLYKQADYTIDSSDPSLEKPTVEILKKINK